MRTNLTSGPIFKTLLLYSLPLMITNVVGVLFHTADTAVLAFMAGDEAVAAVGACGSLFTLLTTLFTCFATGANVLVARLIGAKDELGVRRATGTALVIGLGAGVILMVFAVIFAKDLLTLMQCQPDVLDQATLYMRIYFLGMPITMLYSFIAALLRASGDSVRPMKYMLIAGVLNVGLNVLFVGLFGLAVAGVAVATVLSNLVSLILGLNAMIRSRGMCRIERQHLRLRRYEFLEMLKIALPSCLGAMFFFVSNAIISATVNGMSTDAMAANAYASQFDGFIYTVGTAIASATAVMVGQNFGAGQLDRIKKTIGVSVAYVTAVSLIMGVSFVLLADPLLSILTDSTEIIAIAKGRMTFLCLTYFVTSIMEVYSFSLRSLRRQNATMVVSGICGFGVRCTWTWFVWPHFGTLDMLFVCYTVSAALAIICYLFIYRQTVNRLKIMFSKTEAVHT